VASVEEIGYAARFNARTGSYARWGEPALVALLGLGCPRVGGTRCVLLVGCLPVLWVHPFESVIASVTAT
jgi:hypothetical protein